MGSAQSARGIQLGGTGTAARCGRIPSRDLSPGSGRPPPGAFPPRRCAATGSGSAWKGSGRRWLAASAVSFTAPPARTSPLPGAVDKVLAAPSLPLPGEGRGPLAPGATVDRGGLSSVRPNRVASPGRGAAHVKGARGLRRCRQPTRPVLKHGPRSLTHARVRGSVKTPWRNESEGRRTPAEVGSRPRGAGRTTGPSRPHRRGGGA